MHLFQFNSSIEHVFLLAILVTLISCENVKFEGKKMKFLMLISVNYEFVIKIQIFCTPILRTVYVSSIISCSVEIPCDY